VDWGVGNGIAQTLLPTVNNLARDWSAKRDQRETDARQKEMDELKHLADGPDPEKRDMANAAILKRVEEMQPGFKGKPAKNLMEAIHSGKFAEDPAYMHYKSIAAAHDAGVKQGAAGAGAGAGDFHVTPGTTDQFNKNPAFGVAAGGPPSVPPPMIAAPSPNDPAYGDNAPGAAPAPPQPAAQIEGTGNIQPTAPMASAAGPMGAAPVSPAPPAPPPPEPTISSEMEKLGMKADSRGGYGKTGDALIPHVLSRMTSDKDRLQIEAKAKLAQDREDARTQAAKTKRETDLERQDIKLKAQMERLDKSIKAKGAKGSSGPKQGINYEKERLEAKTDYERYTNALELHQAAEQANLERDAAKNDWDPAQYKAAQERLDDSIEKRRKALEEHHQKVTEVLYGGKAGGPPSDGGPPVVVGGGGKAAGGPPAVASPSAKIVQKNSTTGEFRHSLDGGKTWQPGK